MHELGRPGALFMLGLYGCEKLGEKDKRLLELIKPSGIILFKRNIQTAEQVDRLIGETTGFLGYKPLISIDQEGGVVSRLTEGFTVSPGAMALGRTGNSQYAYEAGKILGKEMKALGIDWDLAPVVDINNNPDNPEIGIRSFGDTREIVTEFAGQFVRGLETQGIIACLKHFPGKGRVWIDAHLDMSVLDVEEAVLFEEELHPYMKIKSPSWMPSHVYYSALQTRKEPASVSREILTDLVRGRLGYDGVLVADNMTMGGITNYYSVAQGVKLSFYAGMDVLLICHDYDKQVESYNVLVKEVEQNETARMRMEESLKRIEGLFLLRNGEKPSRDCLGEPAHLQVMREISGKAVEILKNEDKAIPLKGVDLIYAVDLGTGKVQVEDKNREACPPAFRLSRETGAPVIRITQEILAAPTEAARAAGGRRVVIFTENAHLDGGMKAFIRELSRKAEVLVLCALRNPYDRNIEGVRNAVCSYGYTPMQQESIVDLMLGGG